MVYSDNDEENLSYEFGLLSYAFNFLQHGDLSDPKKVKEFACFFQNTVKEYAVRYVDGQDVFTNASLGELDESLYSQDPQKLKVILFVTAFYTRSCLVSKANSNLINHIDDENHSIKYLTDKIIRNAMQCMIDHEMTNDSVKNILQQYIARVDIHTRGGTKGGGNNFESFAREVNEDRVLSKLCDDFAEYLRLVEKIKFGDKTLKTCKPILIDLLLGICNISLYAAYITAMGEKLRIYLASERSDFVFQQQNDNDGNNDGLRYGLLQLKVADIAFGPHPNAVEIYLTNKSMEVMEQLDDGITAVLQPLDRAPIKIIRNGAEVDVVFSAEEKSDFFQRLHYLRENPDAEFDYDEVDYKLLVEAKEELSKVKGEVKKAREDSKAINSETKAIKKKAREDLKIMRTTAAQVAHDAELEESSERQQKETEATNENRDNLVEEGKAGLQELLAATLSNTDDAKPPAKKIKKYRNK